MQNSINTCSGNSTDDHETELGPILFPFTQTPIPATASIFLDVFADHGPDEVYELLGQDVETIKAYRTLVRNGEQNGKEALYSVMGGRFEYAIENGFIEQVADREHVVTDDSIPQFRLTTKGWLKLEDEGEIELERWDNTIEVEEDGKDFKLHPTGHGTYIVNSFSIPRYVNVETLWEDGLVRVEPSPRVALAHFRGDDFIRLIGTVED